MHKKHIGPQGFDPGDGFVGDLDIGILVVGGREKTIDRSRLVEVRELRFARHQHGRITGLFGHFEKRGAPRPLRSRERQELVPIDPVLPRTHSGQHAGERRERRRHRRSLHPHGVGSSCHQAPQHRRLREQQAVRPHPIEANDHDALDGWNRARGLGWCRSRIRFGKAGNRQQPRENKTEEKLHSRPRYSRDDSCKAPRCVETASSPRCAPD